MTRPRANDYDEKKHLILREAAQLFGGRGFESTTMNDVAEACGTSKSHLYHYFGSKEDLLFAIISEHIESLADELTEAVSHAGSPRQRFEYLVQRFVEQASASRNEHLVLMHALKFLAEAQRQHVRQLQTQLLDLLVDTLGEINPPLLHSLAAAKSYALMVFGTMIWSFSWYRPEGEICPQELAARISEVFLDGFVSARGPEAQV